MLSITHWPQSSLLFYRKYKHYGGFVMCYGIDTIQFKIYLREKQSKHLFELKYLNVNKNKCNWMN